MSHTTWSGFFGLVFFTMVAACVVAACSEPAVELDFDHRAPSAAPTAPRDDSRLVVGVGAMLGPVETYESHTGLLEYLAHSVQREPRLVQRRTYEEMNRLLVSGEVDVAFICDGAYVPIRDRVTLLAVPIFRGEPSYHSVIIARDASLDSLGALRGRSFAFSDPLSQTGRLYAIYRLSHAFHTTPREFFSTTVYSGAHDESVRFVLDGQVDAAAVDEMIYVRLMQDHPDWRARLHVVEQSPAFGAPPVVARQGLPSDVVQRLRAALLAASSAPTSRAYLEDMGIDGFVASTDYTFAIQVAEDALAVEPHAADDSSRTGPTESAPP